jgi:hypothetical protein
MDQMDLAQIGQRRGFAGVRTVPDGGAHMAVAGDSQSRQQANAKAGRLAEVMAGAKADRDDAAHGSCSC